MKLSFEHISKLYGDTAALQQIDLTLGSGVYGLLGPNGAGKTTLMRIMTDLLAPSTGRVLLDGQDIAVMGAAFRKKLGYLPQDFGVYPNFTAEQFLLYIARLKGLSKFEAKRQTDDLLHIVSDLEAVANEIILLRKGVVLEMQKPASLLEHLNGQVWLVTVPAADEAALTKQYACSNVMHTDGKSVIRLLSESAPRPDAVPTAPNMEDLYLYYFGR